VAAAFAEVAIGGAGDFGLLSRDWLHDNFRRRDSLIEAAARNRTPGAVDYDGGLKVVGRRHALRLAPVAQRAKKTIGARLAPNHRDESGRVDDHFGRPRSS
jgi:hypothetical protein